MGKQKGGIVTLGHVLVDYIASVDTQLITELGLDRPVYHTNSAEMRKIMGKVRQASPEILKSFTRSLGGGAAICAKTLASLGIKTTLLGSVGTDDDADFIRHSLQEFGIFFELQNSAKATGVFLSLQTGIKARWLVVSPEAARDIRGTDMNEHLWLDNEILYLDGLLIDDIEWLAGITDTAVQHGLVLALDVSAIDNVHYHRKSLISFAEKYCSYVFANEREFAMLNLSKEQLESSHVCWIVKRGPKGATAIFQNSIEHASSYGVTNLVDDTCAGDAFAGAFLYGLTMGLPVKHCLSLGNSAGKLAVMSCGSLFDQSSMRKTIMLALEGILL